MTRYIITDDDAMMMGYGSPGTPCPDTDLADDWADYDRDAGLMARYAYGLCACALASALALLIAGDLPGVLVCAVIAAATATAPMVVRRG